MDSRSIVLRDREWFNKRPNRITSRIWVQGLPDSAEVDVQSFGESVKNAFLSRKTTSAVKELWQRSNHQPSKDTYNLLNIACSTFEITPPPLLESCGLFHEISDWIRTDVLGAIGKSQKALYRDVSLEGCLRFQIFGFAGAISAWHMDLIAPITWVTLEANNDNNEAEDVLKYWAVVDLHNMSSLERQKALQDFGSLGSLWQPPPQSIKVISLVCGDTLIMPPGTIHCPITVTDCLFRGGMCWDRRTFVKATLPAWLFILKHRDLVTNEDPQTQTQDFLKKIMSDITKRPSLYGLDTAKAVEEALALCLEIITYSTACECTSGCRMNPKCNCIGKGVAGDIRSCYSSCSCNCKK